MPQTSIGFGLLGAGLIAPFHARAIQNSAHAKLVAVAEVDAARREKLATDFGCAGYSTLEEMLENPEVQVVNILTPNHLHYDAVVQSARAGRHVLVEKPPAISLKAMDSMEEICRSCKVKLGAVLQCRVRKPIAAMREAIQQNRFGRLLHADAYMKWFRTTEYYQMDAWRMSRQSGAGVTIQQAFHYLDLQCYLMGPVRSVQARMTNLAHPRVELEDTLLAFMEYENGAQGVVQASTALWPGTDVRIEINGENGTAIMVGERMETWKFKEERLEDAAIRIFGNGAVATGATGPADLGYQDHQTVIEDMVKAILTGDEPAISFPSVRPTLEAALAMYRSAKVQAPVILPLADENVW